LNENIIKHLGDSNYHQKVNNLINQLSDDKIKNKFIENIKNSNLFIEAPAFSRVNIKELSKNLCVTDSDGFGYAARGEHGLFAEKWTNINDIYKKRSKQYKSKIEDEFLGILERLNRSEYELTGRRSKYSQIIIHARMATCGKNIQNTHPISRDGIFSIHNGILNNNSHKQVVSTCDSEGILHDYLDLDILNSFSGIQKLSDKQDGYFAAALLSKDYLDIIKDDKAKLFAANIQKIGLIFCTSLEALFRAAKTMKLKVNEAFKVADNSAMRFSSDGELIDISSFTRKKQYPIQKDNWKFVYKGY
jgi:hypothetical protein